MRFAKYHGTGNDFVMLEDLDDRIELTPELVAALCDRHAALIEDCLLYTSPSPRDRG